MTDIAFRPARRADFRRLILVGLVAAFAVALALSISVSRECKGGAFSSAFSGGFDVRQCDLVLRIGELELRARPPQ